MTKITQQNFGTTKEGKDTLLFTLKNSSGAYVTITNYGGAVVSIVVPNKDGILTDVVLGCDSTTAYENQICFLGALIGRHANRIQNSKFTLNEIEYPLYANDGKNHLHGGKVGYDKHIWDFTVEKEALKLHLYSPDGEEGYPGNLNITVTYTFSDDNTLNIDYIATTDADTVVNLTNHTYFNLGGHQSGTILEHEMKIYADEYTENDAESLPTGVISLVANTPFDFREFTPISAHIQDDHEQIRFGQGFDHNFVLRNSSKELSLAAQTYCKETGILMNTYTTLPGIQFYAGNFIHDVLGKEKTMYQKWNGFCLETQYFPNSLEHKNFPSPILKAGETFCHTTSYQFSCK